MASRDDRPRTPLDTGGSTQVDYLDDGVAPDALEPGHDGALGERYELEGEVARGGLGQILRAWDRVLQRPVAVKRLLRQSGSARRRFDRETRLTAALEHPAIVPVHDAGATPEGDAFFAMKLVDGRSLNLAIADCSSLEERLALLDNVIRACEAVAYAHSRGVIHRDIKPDNILVGAFGETLVIDWGLAKALVDEDVPVDADEGMDSGTTAGGSQSGSLTRVGAVVGTPAYMPPEQATGQEVDARCDVYALGALLYEVLAGQRPYASVPGKEVLAHVVAGPPVPVEHLEPGVPRDLSAIVAKAMRRRPRDRYDDAGGLVADLRRFRTGQFVGAYHYTPAERLGHLVRRRPVVSALVGILALGSLASFAAIVSQRNLALRQRASAEEARAEAEAARVREQRRADEVTMEQAVLALDPAPHRSLELLDQLSPDYADTERMRLVAADALSRGVPRLLRGHRADVHGVVWSPDGSMLATASLDGTVHVRDADTAEVLSVLSADDFGVTRLVWEQEDTLAAVSGRTVRLWDPLRGTLRASIKGHEDLVQEVSVGPGGRLATASLDTTARIWDPDGTELAVLEGHPMMLHSAEFSPDGTRVVTTGADVETLRLWTDEGEELAVFKGLKDQYGASWLPDNRHFVSFGEDPVVYVVDADKRAIVHELDMGEGWVGQVGLSEDGATVVGGTSTGVIRVFALPGGEQIDSFHGHQAAVNWLAVSRDGGLVVSGDDDGVVYAWDRGLGHARRLPGFDRPVRQVELSPDESKVLAGGFWDAALMWDLEQGASELLGKHQGAVRNLCWLRDDAVVSAATDGTRMWSVADGSHRQLVERGTVGLACAPDGSFFATGSMDGALRIFAGDGTLEHTVDCGSQVTYLALSPDGDWLAASGRSGEVTVVSRDGEVALDTSTPVLGFQMGFSADGSQVFVGGVGGTRVWDLDRPEDGPWTLDADQSIVTSVAGIPEGVLTGGTDGSVHLWPGGRGSESTPLDGYFLNVTTMTADAEGRVLAGDGGGTLTLWPTVDALPTTLRGHTQYTGLVRLEDGGLTALSGAWDGAARIWALEADPPVSRALLGHTDNVSGIDRSPDGTRVVTGSWDGTLRIWDDSLSHDPDTLRAEIAQVVQTLHQGAPVDPNRGTMAP